MSNHLACILWDVFVLLVIKGILVNEVIVSQTCWLFYYTLSILILVNVFYLSVVYARGSILLIHWIGVFWNLILCCIVYVCIIVSVRWNSWLIGNLTMKISIGLGVRVLIVTLIVIIAIYFWGFSIWKLPDHTGSIRVGICCRRNQSTLVRTCLRVDCGAWLHLDIFWPDLSVDIAAIAHLVIIYSHELTLIVWDFVHDSSSPTIVLDPHDFTLRVDRFIVIYHSHHYWCLGYWLRIHWWRH